MSDHRLPDMPGAHTPAPLRPCDVFSEEIHLLVDRELGPAESEVVEEHLLGCSRCQALAAHLERMSAVLKAWDAQTNDVEPPALRLRHAVLARVAEQGARRRRDDRMIRVIHYATAAMIVLGLGLGLVLGLTDRTSRVAEPALEISTAPMPLEIGTQDPIRLDAGEPVEPYRGVDLLAGIAPVEIAEIETPWSKVAWDRGVWSERNRDGLPLLVQRFQRLETIESRLGERVVFWNGATADKHEDFRRDDRVVTWSALNFLHERGYLDRWMQASTPRSATVAGERTPVTASRDTGVNANAMLRPMPGIDQELRALQMRPPIIRTYVPKQPGTGAKAKGSAARVHLLDGWGLQRAAGGPRLATGPVRVDPARIRFLDPVAANANGQLHFAESGQGANTVVVIVKDTSGPIYIPAGQFLTGGIADRVIAHPVWLPPTRGTKPFIVHCRVVQNFEHGDASQSPRLQPEIVGPTIRALLASGASPRRVKEAAGRMMASVYRQRGRMLGDWSLYLLYRGRYVLEAQHLRNVRFEQLQGFVVTDARGRFVGSELVRTSGHAATELLRRLWVSYSTESAHRAFAANDAEAFAAPTDGLAQVMRRLSTHRGTFRTPRGVEQPERARVSMLEVVAAGVHLHALEIADSPAIVSALSSP